MESTNNSNQEIPVQEQNKKKSWQIIIVPVIIAVIIVAFLGVIYYAKVIKPEQDFNKSVGYKVEDYIQLNQYTKFNYEITQAMYDDCVSEETDSYGEVKRAAQNTDQVDFDYVGYVDGKKDKNITQKESEIIIGQPKDGAFKAFSEAILKHKAGESVTVDGVDATELSKDKSDYSDKKVTFKIKINSVSKLIVDEVTNKWVKNNYYDDYGLETSSDFYTWCKEYIEDEAKLEVWQKAVDNAQMSGYPQSAYDDIVTEFTQNANYYAAEFGITTDEYLKDFCGYTDKSLEDEYLNEVKSELVMWYIVKKQNIKASSDDIETKYEELYSELGYDNADAMKEDYSKKDIKKAVLLEKAQDYVYKNSNIKKSFKISNK